MPPPYATPITEKLYQPDGSESVVQSQLLGDPEKGTCLNPEKTTITDSTMQPGIYYGGIYINTNDSLTMEPGIYYVIGGGFQLNSNDSVTAEGVTIVNTVLDPGSGHPCGADAEKFEKTSVNPNDDVTFTAPSTGGTEGLLFIQRSMLPNCDQPCTGDDMPLSSCTYNVFDETEVYINNNGDFATGTFYAPDSLIHWNPNGRSVNEAQIIADHVYINNNDFFWIKKGDEIIPIPNTGPDDYVLLIE